MAEVLGARQTANVVQSIRKVDMVPTIKELEPDVTPLTVLSTKLPSAPTGNPEFSWVEDKLEPRFDAINNGAGYASGITSVVVDNGAYFAADEIWKVTRTGELVRVTAVATNTLTIVRGIGGGAAAILDNDELMKVGAASQENSLSRQARSSNPVKVLNYTQIVKHSVEASETWRGSETFTTPRDWDRQVTKKMQEHKIAWEQIYLHGKPTEDLTGAAPLRTSGGAFHFVQTNRTDMGGTMTEAEFFGAFAGGFRYGNQTAKMGFASRLAVSVANGFPMGKLEVVQGDNDTTYGLNIMKYRSPHGTLNLVVHNMLEGAVFGGYILVLDLSQLRKRPMRDGDGGTRDTHLKENVQPPDQDGRKDEVLTEGGLEFGLEKTHFIMSGITG
jgi:hypothetical protein